MGIYEPTLEGMPRGELEQLQIEGLQTTLNRAYRNVAFYRDSFDRARVDIEKIRTLADLRMLPFTTRADVSASSPYGMFAVPLRDIVRIHSTAGTTGQPVGVGYTKNDVAHWARLVARLLAAAGVSDHDFVQIAFPYGMMTGGLGFHYGAERLGASVIPASRDDARKQVAVMKNFKTTVLVGSPSYALTIGNALAEIGLHPSELSLRCGLFGSEPWSEDCRRLIEERLRIKAFDSYGLSEVIGPGVAGECQERNGLHVNEDHFIVEVINPKTLEPAGPEEEGELVFTTIAKEAFPVIRYRTGDMSVLHQAPCPCGRTFARMHRVMGRTDDMLFVQGRKVFPSQLEAVLLTETGISPSFQIVIERDGADDVLEIRTEVSADYPFFDEIRGLEQMRERIAKAIRSALGLEVRVRFVEPRSMIRAPDKKTIRVIDRRPR